MYGDALTTKARVKERLSITATGFDDLLDRLILSATATIQQMCGRRFIYATYTDELYDGSDFYGSLRTNIILRNGPVDSVSRIQYKSGLNSDPNWTTMSSDDYDVDLRSGIVIMHYPLPRGAQNIRVTYTGGFSGYSFGIDSMWFFNVVPTGTVDGSNRAFTLPAEADQVIVYSDGVRELDSNVAHTAGEDTFTLAVGRAPYSSIAVDYQRAVGAAEGDYHLPSDLVDVCERAVVHLFKQREAEGKSSESFAESSITWRETLFTNESLGIINRYRRTTSL